MPAPALAPPYHAVKILSSAMHCCGNTPLPSWSCRESCGHTQRGARASADAPRSSDSCPTTWASSMSAPTAPPRKPHRRGWPTAPNHQWHQRPGETHPRPIRPRPRVLDEHRIKIIPRETCSSKPLVQLILGYVMNLFVATKTGSSITRHSSHPSLPLTRTIIS